MSAVYSRRLDTTTEQAWPTEHRFLTLGLSLGFVLVALAVIVARTAPATGHEVSIYLETPLTVWIFLGSAVLLSITTILVTNDRVLNGFAVVLMFLGAVSFVAIGILRGYRFHGLADPLTHLGWIRDLQAGRMGFTEVYYPAAHSIAIAINELAGVPDERAAMLVVLLFTLVFFIFVGLSVRTVLPWRGAGVIGFLSAFLILPVTNISTELMFHTFTLGSFFFMLVFFLFIRHVTDPPADAPVVGRISPTAIGLTFVLLASILVHPQVALNILIFLAAIFALQVVVGRRGFGQPLLGRRTVYVPFIVMAIAWVAWNSQFPHVFVVGGSVLDSIVGVIEGTMGLAEDTGEQMESVQMVASPFEMYLKLFLVSTVYVLLALGAVGVAARGTEGPMGDRARVAVLYVAASGVLLVPFFLAHIVGDRSHLFFRHVGFSMAIVTFLGAVMLVVFAERLTRGRRHAIVRPLAVGLLAIVLILSLLSVFPSPYIYYQSHHGTDHEFEGYTIAFEYHEEPIPFSGIRRGPSRFVDALIADGGVRTVDSVPGDDLHDLGGVYDEPFYLPITKSDVEREVTAYHELRYEASAIDGVGDQYGVDRVHSNGEFEMYLVSERAIDANA